MVKDIKFILDQKVILKVTTKGEIILKGKVIAKDEDIARFVKLNILEKQRKFGRQVKTTNNKLLFTSEIVN